MASVASALRRIKQDVAQFLPERQIVAACRRAGHRWRERKLGPVQTIHLFVLQVLNFNTAMTGLRHLSKTAVKASSYCKARMRLPLEVLQALLLESSAAMRKTAGPAALWCGHEKRGQVQFAGTARRVLRTNWTCTLVGPKHA